MGDRQPKNQVLSIFDVAADAEATNRGFAVQYLDAVYEWLEAYNTDKLIYCEVQEDVVVFDPHALEREYRQIKSYRSKDLGFGDDEVKHAIYLFYRHSLTSTEPPRFVFVLDGNVRKKDSLMQAWADSGSVPSEVEGATVLRKCVESELATIYKKRKSALERAKSPSDDALAELDRAYEAEVKSLDTYDFVAFARQVFFEVSSDTVEERFQALSEYVEKRGLTLVPPDVVVARCFQAVAVRAAHPREDMRVLSHKDLAAILEEDESAMLAALADDHKIGLRVLTLLADHSTTLRAVLKTITVMSVQVSDIQEKVGALHDHVMQLARPEEGLTFPLIDEVLTWIEDYLAKGIDVLPADIGPVSDTDEKLRINGLSAEIAAIVYDTYADFSQVTAYLRQTKGRRQLFITSTLKQLYYTRRDRGEEPDTIFRGLIRDITPPQASEFKRWACSVLISYFFHACEVFKRVDPR